LSLKQSVAWTLLESSQTVTQVLYGGAAGGGKSWLGCLWQIYRRIAYPGTRGLIGRAKLTNLKKTTAKTLSDIWAAYGIYNPYGVKMQYNAATATYQFSNGSEILLKDLFMYPTDPDFASLGSLELTDAFVDEATEVSEKAVQILSSRIRYRLDLLPVREPKMLLASNPAHNWVKFTFVRDEEGRAVKLKPYQAFVPALLSDNPDPEFQRVYGKQLENLGHYDRRRLLEGDWDAVAREGGEAFYSFDPDLHVTHVPFLPDVPVAHLSFDQNVVPYITLLCAQVHYRPDGVMEIRIFRELCLKHPRNKTKDVCEQFLVEYGAAVSAVYIYGDASGNRADTRAAQSDYDIAMTTLQGKVSSRSNRVQRSNPEVRKRVLFLCAIFEGKVPGLSIVIDNNCHNLKADLLYIKQDANGGKGKKTRTDNGVRYEQYGHTSDALEYLVTTIAEKQFRDFEKLLR